MKSTSDYSGAKHKIREFRREACQERSIYKFDNVQNNRFRNPIRGRSTPKLTGFGGPRRNHHLPRQPGGGHLPGGPPETGKSIERELEKFFSRGFRFHAIAFSLEATGKFEHYTAPGAFHTRKHFLSCDSSGSQASQHALFLVSFAKQSSPYAQIMFHAQSSLLDYPPHPLPHDGPSLLFPSHGDIHCDPRLGRQLGRFAEQSLLTSTVPSTKFQVPPPWPPRKDALH